MKGKSTLAAALALLAATAGLWALSGQKVTAQSAQMAGAWVLEQQLGSLVTAVPWTTAGFGEEPLAGTSPENPASAEVPEAGLSPEPVPVETVAEAWDEEHRQLQTESPAAEIRVDEGVSLELRNGTDYEIDFTQLPALPEGLELREQEPVVLIVHTHTTESYASDDGSFRSLSEDAGVMAVGDAMAQVLRQRGYGVIHDKTLCDYPEYNGAYNRSREVIQNNLEAYPSICLVLDVHRDAVADETGGQMRMAAAVNGEDTAQLMLVVGTDEGGLEHPNWRENLSLAAVLQTRMGVSYPGLMRPINLRSERFNQDLGPLNLLIEVGASGNTLEEALRGARCLSEVLADVLDRYSGKSS